MPIPKQHLSPPPFPLLVTGIAGVSGYNAFQYFSQLYPGQVIGTRRRDNWPLSGTGIVGCDMHNRNDLVRLANDYDFQSVVYCEGTCKLKPCELNPDLAYRVNVKGAETLMKVLGRNVSRLIFVSIDLVFSGEPPGRGYREEDTTDPVTIYGKTMVEAEHLVLSESSRACVLRISLPMGISFNGHAGAIDWIQSRFKKNKPATLYYDEIRTPHYTDCLNRLFHYLLTHEITGLFHSGGPRRLSLYEIAQIVNRVGDYHPEHLIGCPRIEAGPVPPRAGDVSLDSTKLARLLGYVPFSPWPYDDCFVPDNPEWHLDRPEDEPRSPEQLAAVLYHNPLAEK